MIGQHEQYQTARNNLLIMKMEEISIQSVTSTSGNRALEDLKRHMGLQYLSGVMRTSMETHLGLAGPDA